jgi:uroporphyrinogen-III synthase
MKNDTQILCTRPLSQGIIDVANSKGLYTDVLSFIETAAIETVEVQQEIEHTFLLNTTVVFTSMNAVDAVAAYLTDEQPNWQVYCIGFTTQQLVKKYFGAQVIVGVAENAAALAEKIIEDDATDEVMFFCGNQRRDEMSTMLGVAGVTVTEIVVYETIAVPHVVKKDYDAILFFSPSAVDSFFSVNKIKRETLFFAIGDTTAEAIQQYNNGKIIVAAQPGKEALMQQAIDFFS